MTDGLRKLFHDDASRVRQLQRRRRGAGERAGRGQRSRNVSDVGRRNRRIARGTGRRRNDDRLARGEVRQARLRHTVNRFGHRVNVEPFVPSAVVIDVVVLDRAVVVNVAVANIDAGVANNRLKFVDGQRTPKVMVRNLLRQHRGSGDDRRRLARSGHRSLRGIGTDPGGGHERARRHNRRHVRMALRKGRNLIRRRRIRLRAACPRPIFTFVGVKSRANANGAFSRRRRRDAQRRSVLVKIVPRRDANDHAHIGQLVDNRRVIPVLMRGVIPAPKRHINRRDIIRFGVVDAPSQRFQNIVAPRAAAFVREDLQRDNIGVVRDPGSPGGDPGDVRAVSVVVGRVGVVGAGKVVRVDDARLAGVVFEIIVR